MMRVFPMYLDNDTLVRPIGYVRYTTDNHDVPIMSSDVELTIILFAKK